MLSEDASPTMALEPINRCPCPTLRSGQEETCKYTHILLLKLLMFAKRTMNINKQLQVLQLDPFIGRPHSGIDVRLLRLPLGPP